MMATPEFDAKDEIQEQIEASVTDFQIDEAQ